MRAVLDTNVVVSACFWRGAPFDCLKGYAGAVYEAVVSPPLVIEYERVYAELAEAYPRTEPVNWVAALAESADMVFPAERVRGVLADPFDEMVLECALAGAVDCVVSGDKKHLLPLKEFRGIPILSARDFLKLLKSL